MTVSDDAQRIAHAVVNAKLQPEKLRAFYDGVRASAVPFVAKRGASPADVFRTSFDALLTLGKASVPLTVAFTMHQYMFSALALVPTTDRTLAARLDRIIEHLRAKRALLAVSSFGGNVSLPDVRFTISRTRSGSGGAYVLDGERSFQSMASEADYVTVAAPVDGGDLGSFIVPMKRAGVDVGAPVFSSAAAMALTDTRKVTFTKYVANDDELVTLDPMQAHRLGVYSTAWFEGLIGAAYLGGAMAALEEVRRFARAAKAPDGNALSSLDGVVVEAGRLGILLRTSLALARDCATAIGSASEMDDFTGAMNAAVLVKHVCTRNAEAIVQGARRILGTRAMKPDSVLAELTGQVVFGPMHPWLDAEIERNIGAEMLGDAPIDR